MKIDAYSFGRIVVDGREYRSDVIIRPEGVESRWWRQESHRLVPEDLPGLLDDPPQVLIIGTGHEGRMVVSQQTVNRFRAAGAEVIVEPTATAVAEFNELAGREPRVVAALHLTC